MRWGEQCPLFAGQFCDHCLAGVRTCPGHALGGERESVTCEGREFA
ncbi:MAG: hypothetical protein GX927_12245 [Lentisphaerae bacterium]|nr:hypothetical protein [Lentisphaerota bacterium]